MRFSKCDELAYNGLHNDRSSRNTLCFDICSCIWCSWRRTTCPWYTFCLLAHHISVIIIIIIIYVLRAPIFWFTLVLKMHSHFCLNIINWMSRGSCLIHIPSRQNRLRVHHEHVLFDVHFRVSVESPLNRPYFGQNGHQKLAMKTHTQVEIKNNETHHNLIVISCRANKLFLFWMDGHKSSGDCALRYSRPRRCRECLFGKCQV